MRLLLAFAMLVLGTGFAFAEPQSLTWTVAGVERQALVFAPARTAGGTAPLVFVFHGAGDTARNFAGVGFQQAWPEAVVVYMDGLGRGPGQGGAFQTADATAGNRDLAFFDAALVDLRRRFRVDDTRIYATGFSNGAKFVYLLWATRARMFAAFAPVAGMLAPSLSLGQPRPVIHVGGREDHQNEFTLQLESVGLARKANRTATTGTTCGTDCLEYGSPAGAPVRTILHAGGHVYPADTTARIVDFFRNHPLQP